jgi:Ca2+:H+ antiporter
MARWLYWLLLAVPLAFLAHVLNWSEILVFTASAIGLIPLAGLIGLATEELAERVGPLVGGLLNATFGNAPELIIGVAALSSGLLDVVRASITGSIIGNTLLVLGTALLIGGWRNGRQYFDARNAGQYASMLALAVIGLVLPALANAVGPLESSTGGPAVNIDAISIAFAAILLSSYIAYLAYTVFHVHDKPRQEPRDVREGEVPAPEEDGPPLVPPSVALADEQQQELVQEARAARGKARSSTSSRAKAHTSTSSRAKARAPTPPPAGAQPPATRSHARKKVALREIWRPVILLAGATIATAIVSELLVGAIVPVTQEFGWSQIFVGLIIVPIVGNAAEHTSAITMAVKDRVDVSMAITAGSSIQVALLVAPVLVLVSFPLNHPLDLVFRPLELVIFGLATFLFPLISLDGESIWLEGLLLLAFYLMVGVVAFYL